ncbi:class I SAM-dependent methyltransferase [Candidatus Microgenomates bacterium]|nr:class I SAM-dependent methyltransferase [Candidatus Microgenomates bacterium]
MLSKLINELNGLAFKSTRKWSKSEKLFFFHRYSKIFSQIPSIKRGQLGLEIGLCGGIIAFYLKRRFELDKLYTLEHPLIAKQFSKKYLSALKNENIILKSCDLHTEKLPWKDNFFDFVVFSEVMEHLIPPKLPFVFNEIKRVLKPNGWLLVTTPNISSFIKRVNLLRGKNPTEFNLNLHKNATFGHIREYSMDEVESIVNKENFKTVKKWYFMIDENRNLALQIESIVSKFVPSLANNIAILAKKR